jgi:hypothetical protein
MASISAVGGGVFNLSSIADGTGGTSSALSRLVDSYLSSSLLPAAFRTRFGLLSHKLHGLTLSILLRDLPSNTRDGPSVTVRLPIDQSLLDGRNPGLNTVACMFWDESSGSFGSNGFVPSSQGWLHPLILVLPTSQLI